MKNKWFYGKTVIITGASSGFGKLIAKKLIKKYNCNVIGIARTESKLQSTKEELGDKFTYRPFDTGIKQNWLDFANYLNANDIKADILINNAGVLPPFTKFTGETETFDKVMQTNFYAYIYAAEAMLDIIRKSETPAIINVSSSAALASIGGTSAYTSSKSALKSFTEVLALENPDMYIAVICPGFSNTEIFRSQKFEKDGEIKTITKLSSKPEKLTDKMLKKIAKKKMRIVVGYDARLTDFFARLFPVTTMKLIRKCLKKSKLSIFDDVYGTKN